MPLLNYQHLKCFLALPQLHYLASFQKGRSDINFCWVGSNLRSTGKELGWFFNEEKNSSWKRSHHSQEHTQCPMFFFRMLSPCQMFAPKHLSIGLWKINLVEITHIPINRITHTHPNNVLPGDSAVGQKVTNCTCSFSDPFPSSCLP